MTGLIRHDLLDFGGSCKRMRPVNPVILANSLSRQNRRMHADLFWINLIQFSV